MEQIEILTEGIEDKAKKKKKNTKKLLKQY